MQDPKCTSQDTLKSKWQDWEEEEEEVEGTKEEFEEALKMLNDSWHAGRKIN